METYIVLVLTGLIAGMLGSIVGLGGAVIMLPITQMVLEFDTAISIGTTLFAVIFTSLSSTWAHSRSGNVHFKTAAYVGGGGILGIFVGSHVFKKYLANSTMVLQFFLGCLFLFMAFRMGRDVYRVWQAKKGIKTVINTTCPFTEKSTVSLILVGVFTGIFAAILGIGGGFIMVPALICLFALPPHIAVGTTFFAMLPIALSGGLIKLYDGFVNLNAGILMGLGTALGAQLGVYVSRLLSPTVMRIIFAVLFFILGINYTSRLLLTFF
jgi:uncharacterized membrane protein YfcA